LASGFAPGTPDFFAGLTKLRAAQSHAWGEVYIPDYGWIPFDPVPGGYLPDCKPNESPIDQIIKSDTFQRLLKILSNLFSKSSWDSFISQLKFKLPDLKLPDLLNSLHLQGKDQLLIALALALISIAFLSLGGKTYLDKHNGKRNKLRASSTIFLQVMKMLRKIKIKREQGDTPQEIMKKVKARLEELGKPKWQKDLPDLLASFLDSYCLNRFALEESTEMTNKLKEQSKQIKELLASEK
jgi:hypothetical protein